MKKLEIYNGSFYKNSLDAIGYLTELEELVLKNTAFKDDSDFSSLKNLANLINFELTCSTIDPLKTFSPNFFLLTKLKSLTLIDCPYTTFTTSLENSLIWSNLINLENLILKNNIPGPIDLDDPLFDPPNLKYLNLKFNKYSTIPENIGNLKKLEILDVSDNELISLPKAIGDLESLKFLYLDYNQITSIPDEIGNLKNLIHTNLSYNNITNIPSSLGNLENLEELYLNNNFIDDYIPESLNNLPKLHTITLDFNINIKGKTLSSPNLQKCKYSPPRRDYTYSYSLCESSNATCKNPYDKFPQCEEIDEPSDASEPSDGTDNVEPSDDIEPSDDVELFDYDEIFNYVEPSD